MTNKITEDPRIDPRIKEQWKDINFPEVLVESSSREEMLAKVNTEEGQMELMMYEAVFNDPRLDDAISSDGLKNETIEIDSQPDGNKIKLLNIRPDNEDILPCVYYIHGGGMEIGSCFYKLYQAFGRLIAHQNVSVIMVDFRNARVPSSAPEVAPFPAGLNDCVSGFDYIKTNAKKLNIDSKEL